MSDEVEYIDMDDGAQWFFSPGLNIWTGWQPGEDGNWIMEPEEFEKVYGRVTTDDEGSE